MDPWPFVTPQAEQSAQFLPALENQSVAEPAPTRPLASPEALAGTSSLALPQISSVALLSATSTATPPSSRKAIKAGLEASDPNQVQLASGEVQLIEFFAFWCGTCRAMAPIVHGLEAEYGERMNFVYLDIDDPDTDPFKEALGYRVQPHIFLVDERGKILREWLGRADEADLRQAFDNALD
jgi:thiol-disulfide isomerase/thioredoxin